MLNSEHLTLLTRGVHDWNGTRLLRAEFRPQLMWADLNEANLQGVDFREADLSGSHLGRSNLRQAMLVRAVLAKADLRGANLSNAIASYADLTEALLRGADLSEAVFGKAILRHAHLRSCVLRGTVLLGADLRGADLREADLTGANLTRANLTGADLRGATIRGTRLMDTTFSQALFGSTLIAEADLSTCLGLEAAEHAGPSSLGLDSFFTSRAQLPESFLRGCGTPEEFLRFAAVCSGSGVLHHSFFLLHSPTDADLARRLQADLQREGVRCWRVRDAHTDHDVTFDAWRVANHHDRVVVLVSKAAMEEAWLQSEVQRLLACEKREDRIILFPVGLDPAGESVVGAWADVIHATRTITDFSSWTDPALYDVAFQKLLGELQSDACPEKASEPGSAIHALRPS